MQNFTTQEHQRNNPTVLDNPGKTIANLREKQRSRNLVNGVIISAMALAVVVTGSVLGSTVAHNQQLKGQLGELTTQNQTLQQQMTAMSTANETPAVDKIDTAAYYRQPNVRIVDRADLAPDITTTGNPTNRTANPNCPDGNCTVTTDRDTDTANTSNNNQSVTNRNITDTVTPVMAEPTADADKQHASQVTKPAERPALYANRYREPLPDDSQATPMPRMPRAPHARVR